MLRIPNLPTLTLVLLAFFTPLSLVSQQANSPCANPTPPKAVYAPDPIVPDSWVGTGRSSETVIGIMVDRKGKGRDLHVVKSGGKEADEAALAAVRQWRFTPAKCGKTAIEAKVTIHVRIVAP